MADRFADFLAGGADLRAGQIWECQRGRHVGARFEVLGPFRDWDDWWLVKSLTAKQPTVRSIFWPDLSATYRLVHEPPDLDALREMHAYQHLADHEGVGGPA